MAVVFRSLFPETFQSDSPGEKRDHPEAHEEH
jgi:hypothetical protein